MAERRADRLIVPSYGPFAATVAWSNMVKNVK